MSRAYEMSNRTAAMERTREVILERALELFTGSWFDEVTIADVARAAGVSQQTVVNHFGSKIGLYLTGLSELVVPRIAAARQGVRPGDVDGVVGAVLRDYEESGDGTVRTLALALRVPELAEVVEGGRRAHRAWVEEVFGPQLARHRGAARDRLANLLVTAVDVQTWHQLRRREGLGREQVRRHLRQLVEAILEHA